MGFTLVEPYDSRPQRSAIAVQIDHRTAMRRQGTHAQTRPVASTSDMPRKRPAKRPQNPALPNRDAHAIRSIGNDVLGHYVTQSIEHQGLDALSSDIYSQDQVYDLFHRIVVLV